MLVIPVRAGTHAGGAVSSVRVERVGRGWQWSTAVAGCLTLLAAVSPATRQASATVVQSTGRIEHMSVRAIPGHVRDAEPQQTRPGGPVGRELSIISALAPQL